MVEVLPVQWLPSYLWRSFLLWASHGSWYVVSTSPSCSLINSTRMCTPGRKAMTSGRTAKQGAMIRFFKFYRSCTPFSIQYTFVDLAIDCFCRARPNYRAVSILDTLQHHSGNVSLTPSSEEPINSAQKQSDCIINWCY